MPREFGMSYKSSVLAIDIKGFLSDHSSQVLATIALVTYASLRRKLTLDGILAGIVVALLHMMHPWPAFFGLLMLFFLFGTLVTRIGHVRKAHLTLSSTGGSGGEGARTSAQVFANSGFACLLIVVHNYLLKSTPFISSNMPIAPGPYAPTASKLLPIGILAQYAAVAADTFSSELGILAKSQPFWILDPRKQVPRGTNGGVTVEGLAYGGLGSFLLALLGILALLRSRPYIPLDLKVLVLVSVMGAFGSIIDSALGALLQTTVTDKASGKVVEGPGGQRVRVAQGGSRAAVGWDLLTNNGINFAMASITSLLAMGVAYLLDLGIAPS